MLTRRSLSQNNIKVTISQSDKKKETIKIEYEEEEEVKKEETNLVISKVVVKSKTVTRKDAGGGWKPKKWEEMWALIKEMRTENPAAVDTMGAHCLMDTKASKNE